LVANWKECTFAQLKVYLGHVISLEVVAMDPSKVECVHQWSIPKHVKGGVWFLRPYQLLLQVHPQVWQNCQATY
jgi:hypothetical protein